MKSFATTVLLYELTGDGPCNGLYVRVCNEGGGPYLILRTDDIPEDNPNQIGALFLETHEQIDELCAFLHMAIGGQE